MYNIMVYNNNTKIVEIMKPLFKGEQLGVMVVDKKENIKQLIENHSIQLLLTDIKLDGEDGIQSIRELRTTSSIPIIVLSGCDDDYTKIAALNAGADDYVIYPCNPLELLARVKSQMRRYTQLSNLTDNIEQIYRVDDLEIDDRMRRVTIAGKEIKLTPIEYKILHLLVQERGKVFSIEQIYESIWKMQAIGADNTIAVHIRHIREKIEENPKQPHYLQVVWGTGYKVG